MRKYLSILSLSLPSLLLSLPVGPRVDQGNATIDATVKDQLSITCSDHTWIDWEEFSIGDAEMVSFLQPSSDSLAVNRVVGLSPTEIQGLLRADGRIVLVNPQGVCIGPKGAIDTSSLIAAACDLSRIDEEFHFSSRSSFVNEGSLTARNGQVVILAKEVFHRGSLIGEYSALLGSEKAQIKAEDFSRVFVTADALTDTSLTVSGSVLSSLGKEKGGDVLLLAGKVSLLDSAKVDVSGLFQGGSILVGTPGAISPQQIQVDPLACLTADATVSGDGGKISLFATDMNLFRGTLFARGGSVSGNGGDLEISGRHLAFDGRVNCSAPFGKDGHLLLDPTDIVIGAALDPGVVVGNPTTWTGGNPVNISAAAIAGALAGTSVTINTAQPPSGGGAGNIQVQTGFTWATGNSLTLIADGIIDVQPGADITPSGIGGSVFFTAGTGMTLAANVFNNALSPGAPMSFIANTGNITIGTTAANVNVGNENGTILVQARTGSVIVSGGSGTPSWAGIGAGTSLNVLFTGNIRVEAFQDIILNAGVGSNSTAYIGQAVNAPLASTVTRNITVVAGRDILLNGQPNPGTSFSFAEIGFDFSNTVAGINRISDISVNAGRNLILTTGSNFFCRAHIGVDGTGGGGSVRVNIDLNTGGNLVIQGQPFAAGLGNIGYIGFGVPQSNSATSIQARVGGNLYLDGRNLAFNAVFIPSYTAAFDASYPAECSLRVLGDVIFLPGLIAHNDIPVGSTFYVDEVWTGGSFICLNSATGVATPAGFLGGGIIQNVAYRSAGDIVLGGSGGSAPATNIINSQGTGSYPGYVAPFSGIFIEAGSCFDTGELWPALFATVNGSNVFIGTPLGAPSPNIACDTLGAFGFDMSGYNLNGLPYPYNGLEIPVPVTVAPASGYTLSTLAASGNIILHSAETFVGEGFRAMFAPGTTAVITVVNPPFVFPQLSLTTATGRIEISGADGPSFNNCPCLSSFDTITLQTPPNPWTTNAIYISANNDLFVNGPVVSSGVGSTISLISDHDGSGLGDLTILADVTTNNGNILLDAGFNGPLGGSSSIFINGGTVSSGTGSQTIQALEDIIVQGTSPSILSTSGSISLTANNDLQVFQPILSTSGSITSLIGNNTLISNTNITTGGPIQLVTGDDMNLVSAAIASNGSSVTLVVDNDFPARPLIGPGAFIMDGTSLVQSDAGIIRIFTALQGQNLIDAGAQFINAGVPYFFSLGTLFVDTAREIWCIYFPSGLSGVPFTIFYKDCLQQVTQQATEIIDEMLVDLHPYNEYPGWVCRFLVQYADELKERENFYSTEPYRITRRELKFVNHPKSWTHLTNP